jgi:hypothetical protein
MASAKYRIYVRLKNGDQVTGRELYKGPPPASGTELEVPLCCYDERAAPL